MGLLNHLKLFTDALSLASQIITLHILLAYLNLHLANILLLVLQLIFEIDTLRLQLLNLLPQVEFNDTSIFHFHFLSL